MVDLERPTLSVIWDFDSALGQVAATFPYHFRRAPLDEELAAVDVLRSLGERLSIRMTFATVGFAVEPVPAPFGAKELVQSLGADGHEIASHSWRHEWLPHLTTQQLRRSLLRSKLTLEAALGEVGAVTGLVPPFNRPMSWPRHGEVRLGDRWALPPAGGATVGRLLREANGAGYRWVRVHYKPRFGPDRGSRLARPIRNGGCIAIPHHYNGFDDHASSLLDEAVSAQRLVVLTGHPAGLFRTRNENRAAVTALLERAARLRDAGALDIATVAEVSSNSATRRATDG